SGDSTGLAFQLTTLLRISNRRKKAPAFLLRLQIWQGWRDSNSQHADLEFYKTKHKNSMLEQFKNQSTRISVYFGILFSYNSIS
ncbi:hypothetical protein AB6D92_15300, partial [Vibrio splendidus]